jgi:3',5'-cyclic AMP phosphodiesterase CpdA
VTFPPSGPELTTVATDYVVVHEDGEVRRHDDLRPDTAYEIEGFELRTLPEPGALLTTFATMNDVHFGEKRCGVIEGIDLGPVFSTEPDDDPYPEIMNRGAVAEAAALDPAVVVVKGDLTSDGSQAEYERFLEMYQGAFDGRLVHVRGNHESYHDLGDFGAIPTQSIDLPGVRLAVLDTSRRRRANGGVSVEQAEWLDELARTSDRPVLVFGHHHAFNVDHEGERPDDYFGIVPDDSDRLVEVVARRPAIVGYFAGHTHRNRVRRFRATGSVPFVEVACVKDYPGAWAEYRVYEHGILQVFHRIATPEALEWTEKTRHMYAGAYADYAFGSIDERCFLIETDRRPAGA